MIVVDSCVIFDPTRGKDPRLAALVQTPSVPSCICTSEPRSLELLFQIFEREPERCRAAVGAVAAALNQLAAGEEGFDFLGGEGIAGFDGGFAGHHV